MNISACLVIRNEEKVLSRCLESLKDAVGEIIIIHDGDCTDKSIEISKKHGAKIFLKPFVGVAEPHRPFSYEKATKDWIFQIDADEYLSEKAKRELPKLIQNKGIDAYSFAWPYYSCGKYISYGPFSQTFKTCLLRKNKMYMLGIAQEYPRTYGFLEKRSDILLEHKPEYDNFTAKIFREKWTVWAKLQARQIKDIESAPTFNIHKPSDNKLLQHYLFIRKHPILTGLTETIRFICIYIWRGILLSGWTSINIAYLNLSYLWLVKKYLELLKYGRTI